AAGGLPAAAASKAATSTIPIVFDSGEDPVKAGLVASLSRPAGNLTGVSNLNTELGPKRLELLHEVVPSISTVAFLLNPANPLTKTLVNDVQAAAERMKLQLWPLYASREHEFEAIFQAVAQRAAVLAIGADGFFNSRVEMLGRLSAQYRVPAVFQNREFATE